MNVSNILWRVINNSYILLILLVYPIFVLLFTNNFNRFSFSMRRCCMFIIISCSKWPKNDKMNVPTIKAQKPIVVYYQVHSYLPPFLNRYIHVPFALFVTTFKVEHFRKNDNSFVISSAIFIVPFHYFFSLIRLDILKYIIHARLWIFNLFQYRICILKR